VPRNVAPICDCLPTNIGGQAIAKSYPVNTMINHRSFSIRTASLWILILSSLLSTYWGGAHAQEPNQLIQTLATDLSGKNKQARLDAIEAISSAKTPRKLVWLQSMLDGNMYVLKSDDSVVIASKEGKEYAVISAVDGANAGLVGKRELRKIKINNALRKLLKAKLGLLALEDPDTDKRLEAVRRLAGDLNPEILDRIRSMHVEESEPDIKQALALIIAVTDLANGTVEHQEAALNFSTGRLESDLINALRDMADNNANLEIRLRASTILAIADNKRKWLGRVENLFFGISLGSVLVVAAIGLAITFGVMGVINMAHGELIMLGAYTTWFIQQLFPGGIAYSLLLAIPAAFLVSGTVGIIIERTVIRHLYGRPLETLLATFGISLLLQQFVRTVVSSQNVAVINPVWMSGSWAINPALSFSLNRMVIIAFCFVVFALLLLIFTRTGYGLQMRAVAQNRQMARAMGIRSARVDALTFGLGSGIAGIAGVALSQLGNVGPNLGQSYIIDSFMVVVFGGVGNLWGTLVAGMSLGIANKFLEPWAGAVLAKIIILVGIILFIQNRPRGLFPQRGRAAED
jgi:urea transport system permease protein